MKPLAWNSEKATLLRNDPLRKNVGFEECALAIADGRILDDIPHPSSQYPDQRMMILKINGYAYVVPYVESEVEIFLKTVFPSRKHTAIYLTE